MEQNCVHTYTTHTHTTHPSSKFMEPNMSLWPCKFNHEHRHNIHMHTDTHTHTHMHTIFARSDATVAIYFMAQFCVASIWEWCLLNSGWKMKKSTASRKVEWQQMPGSQSKETWPRLPLQQIPSLRSQTPSQMLKMSWRRTSLS